MTAIQYTSAGQYAGRPYDPLFTMDVSASYEFRPAWAHAPRLQLGLGILNITNLSPPWTDTLSGYRSGSPLGRTLELSLRSHLGGG